MSDQAAPVAGNLRLLHFVVVSRTPVKDRLKITGTKVTAPSPKRAWQYLKVGLDERSLPSGKSTLEDYKLSLVGESSFGGSENEWIQAQLQLNLAPGERALQFPAADGLEKELEDIASEKPKPEPAVCVPDGGSPRHEPVSYRYSEPGPGPFVWAAISSGVLLTGGSMIGGLLGPLQGGGEAGGTGAVNALATLLTGPVAAVVGTLLLIVGGMVLAVSKR